MKRVDVRPHQTASRLLGMLLLGCGLAWSSSPTLWAGEPAAPVQPATMPVVTPAANPAAPKVVPNSECLDCHEAEFKSRKKGLPKEWVGVRPELFAKSVHAKLNCVDCHATLTEPEHPSKLP